MAHVAEVDVTQVATRAELATALSQLRDAAGMSYRRLASAIDSSSSTVNDWCAGRTLPFPAQDDVFAAMVTTLGADDPDAWLDALRRVRDASDGRRAGGPPAYRGLQHYRTDDAERYFGRASATAAALGRLDVLRGHDGPTLLAVVGPSGVGKSSLLHAGIAAGLADGRDVVTLGLTATPRKQLAEALDDVGRGDLAAALPWVDGDGDAPPAAAIARPLTIVLDQFEMLFQHPDPTAVDEFGAAVRDLAATDDVEVVVGLRIDHYADASRLPGWRDVLERGQHLLAPMTSQELTEAITEPARRAGTDVEDGLVRLLLRDVDAVGGDASPVGSLPLLSHALLQTWERAGATSMTIADYEATGGIDGAVAATAEDVLADLDGHQRDLARHVLLRLVRVTDHGLVTRRTVDRDELLALGDGTADVVEQFVHGRICTAHAATVELAHEVVLTAWPRLRHWIEAERGLLVVHRQAADATAQWLEHDRDDALLARGPRLALFQQLLEATGAVRLTADERAYLDASATRERDEATRATRRRRQLRGLAAATTVLALVAGAAAVLTSLARAGEVAARDDARSRLVAVTADRIASQDTAVAGQLATSAFDIAATDDARATLLEVAGGPVPRTVPTAAGNSVVASDGSGDVLAISDGEAGAVTLVTGRGDIEQLGAVPFGEAGTASALAFSPDDTLLAVGDATVQLWDVTDPAAPAPVGEPLAGPAEGAVQHVSWSPDGGEVAIAGQGVGIRRWQVTDPAAATELPTVPFEGLTWSVDHHPDGGSLALSTDTGLVQTWDVSGEEPTLLAATQVGDRRALSVHHSPDGQHLAAAFTVIGTAVGRVGVFDLDASDEQRAELGLEPGELAPVELADAATPSFVNRVRFSPDGQRLVAAGADGTVRLWATATWTPLLELAHPSQATSTTFAGDGTLVTGALDGAVRSFNAVDASPQVLDGRVFAINFTASGQQVAVFSGETVAVWDLDLDGTRPVLGERTAALPGDPTSAGTGTISPDGMLLARGSLDGVLRLYDLAGGAPQLLEIDQGDGESVVQAAAFSVDGDLLAAGGSDQLVRLWSTADPGDVQLLGQLDDAGATILDLEFHPSQPLLAAASLDAVVRLYDLGDPAAPRVVGTIEGLEADAHAAAFSPDGQRLAIGGSDGLVQLWDVGDPAAPEQVGEDLTGPVSRVFQLDWSGDGAIVSASITDGQLWSWSVPDDGEPVRRSVFGPAAAPYFGLAHSPTDDLLVASGGDGRVRLWSTDPTAAAASICERIGAAVTEQRWRQLLAGVPYREPCAG